MWGPAFSLCRLISNVISLRPSTEHIFENNVFRSVFFNFYNTLIKTTVIFDLYLYSYIDILHKILEPLHKHTIQFILMRGS